MDSKLDHWYIKQGDRTLGPVDRAYVEKCLLNRELLFTDYVSEGGKPWKMIRDVAALEPILREVEVRGPPPPAEVPPTMTKTSSSKSSPFIGNSVPLESGTGSVSNAKSELEVELPPENPATKELEPIPVKPGQKGPPKGFLGAAPDKSAASDKLELDLEQYGRRPRETQQGEVRLAPNLVNRRRSRKSRRRRRKIKKVLRFVGAMIVMALGFFITKYLNEKH